MLFENIKERDEKFSATILDYEWRLAAAIVERHRERDELIKIAQGASPVARATIARDPDIGDFMFEQLDARDAGENPPETTEIRTLRRKLFEARESQRNLRLHEVRNLDLAAFEALDSTDRAKVHATDPEVYAGFLDEITDRNTESFLDEEKRDAHVAAIKFQPRHPGEPGSGTRVIRNDDQ